MIILAVLFCVFLLASLLYLFGAGTGDTFALGLFFLWLASIGLGIWALVWLVRAAQVYVRVHGG